MNFWTKRQATYLAKVTITNPGTAFNYGDVCKFKTKKLAHGAFKRCHLGGCAYIVKVRSMGNYQGKIKIKPGWAIQLSYAGLTQGQYPPLPADYLWLDACLWSES